MEKREKDEDEVKKWGSGLDLHHHLLLLLRSAAHHDVTGSSSRFVDEGLARFARLALIDEPRGQSSDVVVSPFSTLGHLPSFN
ncbi:hypothetical protein TYRP_006398 [Tyrophagus putrescentiae]|nr:hypothetical protein TYRP_006398 [Tyrophagus putrescentiae]